MAIKVSGIVVIDDNKDISNVGVITATKIVKSGGTSDQYLKADGSITELSPTDTGKIIAMSIVFG